MPDDWDENTDVHCLQAEMLRKRLMEELDQVTDEVKRKDPRRE